MTYTWLPAQFCKVGNVLKLKNDDGSWTDGWKVKEVFGYATGEMLDSLRVALRDHRKYSDI